MKIELSKREIHTLREALYLAREYETTYVDVHLHTKINGCEDSEVGKPIPGSAEIVAKSRRRIKAFIELRDKIFNQLR